MKRRIASSLLALCMLLSLLPTVALAGESAAQASPATEVRTAQELEAAVSGGGAVRLMADIDLTGSLFITTDVTLDLNGKVLRGDGSGSVIRIETAAQLVLEDSSPETVHKFDTSQPLWTLAAEDASGEHIKEVKGGVITGGKAQYGGGIYVSDKAGTSLPGLTMNGGNIVGCAANGSISNGGGVYAHYSVFRMTGGSIRGCTTNEKSNLTRTAGAGVYISGGNGDFTMTGGTISDCKAGSTTGGDAVCIASSNTPFRVTDGVIRGSISNNGNLTGGTFEGTVYNVTWGNIIAGTFNGPVINSGGTITGGVFSGPVTNDSGTIAGGTFNGGLTGAEIIGLGTAEAPYQIFSEQDLATVQSKISDSSTLSARLMGDITGNLIVQGSVTLDLNGKVFKSADSSKSVIIAALRSSLTILDSDPGAVHRFDASQALWTLAAEDAAGEHIKEVKGGVITGGSNPTGSGGGVTLASGCTLLMQGGSIVGCRADRGGGINSAKDCSITLSGKAGILGCTAQYGGGVWLTEAPLTLAGSAQITGCTAEELGGGIYVRTGPLTMEGGSISDCQAADAASGQTSSSGIYLDSSATMYAEGGQVDGAVLNKGTIGRSSSSGFGTTFTQPVNSTGTIGGGVFNAQVDSTLASITGGVFHDKVISSGSAITGGEFTGEVYSRETNGPSGTVSGTIGKDDGNGPYFAKGSSLYINSGTVKGGSSEGSVQVSAPGAVLENGNFDGTVKIEAGSISGGAFLGKTEIDIAAGSTAVVTIHDGIFYGDVDMNTRGRPAQAVINGGTYLGSVTGDGTINDSAKVTVRFDTAGGTATDSQRILRGQKAQEPQTTRSGYTLNGWYDRYQPWNFSRDAVREDMTLWAGWTVEQQFTLQPGETYWFDLSAMGIPGTVNADTAQAGGSSLGLPDATMHYVPFTYAGTADAYVLNSASGGKSNASDLASVETEKSGLYGYNYPHSLFIAQHNVTHSVSWDSLNKEGFIFGKDYSSGGIHYTLRAPSVGSHDDYNYFGRYAEPENNEWNSIFNDSTQDYDDNSGGWIKNWAGQYSWGQDTFRYSTDGTERIVRGLRTADTIVIVPMSAGSQGADAAQYGYRPVLEVLNAGVLGKDGLKAVALALNGGSIGGQQEIRMVVKNGAAFTAPGGSGLTAPQGLEAANLYWLGSNGKSYSPGTSVPAEVTTLTAQWTTGHSHCICGGAAYDGHTACTDVTWLPWAADDSLPTTGGHYYLLQDVTLTAEQEISSSLHLCLNGKTVRYGGSSGETPITVGSSGALSVYDCAGTGRMEAFVSVQGALTAVGGRISGGTSVQVQPDAALTLTGRAGNDGTITVSAGADFLMEGSAENSGTIQFMQPTDQGRVFRGQADSSGGTVELRQPAQGAGLQICGQARLGDITCADPGLVLNVEKTAAICGVMDVGESSVSGTVTCSGELRSGIFRGDVVNNGRITGGIFYGTVTGSGTIEESAKVTLSFRTDGSPVPAEQRILRGQKAAVPEKPRKNGYIFGGWYLGGALYDFDTPVLTEAQLEAGWTVRSGYSVLFDTGGGSAAADRTGLRWTDKVLSGVDEPTRSGWQFRFWLCGDVTVTEDTTYADLAERDSVTEITLTARWKDAEKPTGSITIGQSTWQTFQETLTYTQFLSGSQTVTIDASDNSGRVQVGYYVTTEDLTPAQLTGLVMHGYEGSFTLQEDGRYIVYALLVDDNLNITCLRSDGITLDSTPPVISGITAGEVFCGPVTVTVREENLQEVRVDNVPVSLNENGQFVLPAKAGAQTVTAYDRAGNIAEVTVTVNAGHSGGEATCKDKAVCGVCGESYGELNSSSHVGGIEVRGSKNASCTGDGYTGDTFCLGCGARLSEGRAIPATGHSGGEATCKDRAVCGVCGESYGELNSSSHVGGTEIRSSKNASCTGDGHTGDTFCLGCGARLSEGKAIPATGHSGGEATCKDRAVCSVCGESYGELNSSSHVGGTEVRGSKNASCTGDGYTGDTFCLGCGARLSEGRAIPATGHSGGEATCKDQAVCSVCGESYGELNSSKHLQLRHIAAKEATSAETGNIEYWYCDDCRRCFADEAGLREIDRHDTVIAKLPEEPETGDRGNPALWLGLLAASGIAAGTALLKKRRDSSAG